jgi:hypothetical protein
MPQYQAAVPAQSCSNSQKCQLGCAITGNAGIVSRRVIHRICGSIPPLTQRHRAACLRGDPGQATQAHRGKAGARQDTGETPRDRKLPALDRRARGSRLAVPAAVHATLRMSITVTAAPAQIEHGARCLSQLNSSALWALWLVSVCFRSGPSRRNQPTPFLGQPTQVEPPRADRSAARDRTSTTKPELSRAAAQSSTNPSRIQPKMASETCVQPLLGVAILDTSWTCHSSISHRLRGMALLVNSPSCPPSYDVAIH